MSPLMKALVYNLPGLALLFLRNTVDVNVGDSNQLTPIHVAAMYGHQAVVVQLCLKGGRIM